jgi:hypothetical protein
MITIAFLKYCFGKKDVADAGFFVAKAIAIVAAADGYCKVPRGPDAGKRPRCIQEQVKVGCCCCCC